MAIALASLLAASGPGTARAQNGYQPPPPYQPPSYAPRPYTPPSYEPPASVAQQPLPPPPPAPPAGAAPPAAMPSAELPLGPAAPPAPTSTQADAASAVREAITGWADDFNALKSGVVCDLFAPDLKYDFGTEPGNYSSLCKRLKQALGNTAVRYRYTPDIQEILISGEMAVVHIVWTLSVSRNGTQTPTVVIEPAMFVLRHDPDGRWRVFRFLAFDVPKRAPKS